MNKQLVITYAAVILLTLFGLLLIKELNISYPLTITTSSRSSELSVVGEGKVEVVPDTVTIEAGVSINLAPSVEEAQKQVDAINNKIIAQMKELGLESKDIKTSNYSINPSYDYNKGNVINGYNAYASTTIKTSKTELAPQIVSRATAAGANQINGVQYSVKDPAKFREGARKKAIENAKEQAQKLSQELGIKLGKITNIVESTPYDNSPVYYKAAAAEAGGGAGGPDIEPGSQEISSVVTLYFATR